MWLDFCRPLQAASQQLILHQHQSRSVLHVQRASGRTRHQSPQRTGMRKYTGVAQAARGRRKRQCAERRAAAARSEAAARRVCACMDPRPTNSRRSRSSRALPRQAVMPHRLLTSHASIPRASHCSFARICLQCRSDPQCAVRNTKQLRFNRKPYVV